MSRTFEGAIEVEALVSIVPKEGDRTFKDVRVEPQLGDWKFQLNPEALDVTVHGPLPALHALAKADIRLSVDLTTLRPGGYRSPMGVTGMSSAGPTYLVRGR